MEAVSTFLQWCQSAKLNCIITHCHEILISLTRKVTLILFYGCFVMPTYLRTKH